LIPRNIRISRRALGKTFTGLGILVWVPYGVLTIGGSTPSILPFLAVHLAGILGGLWIKRMDHGVVKENPMVPSLSRRRIGSILMIIALAVWVPYFILKDLTVQQVNSAPFIVVHVSAALSGLLLRLGLLDWVRIDSFRRRRADEPSPQGD